MEERISLLFFTTDNCRKRVFIRMKMWSCPPSKWGEKVSFLQPVRGTHIWKEYFNSQTYGVGSLRIRASHITSPFKFCILVSLVRSRNSCGSWTVTKEVLPCFYNILTSRLLLSWLVGNTTLQGSIILLKPHWILQVNSILRKSNCRWPMAQRMTSRSLLLIPCVKCAPIPALLENAVVKCCREAQEEASGPWLLWRFTETNTHMPMAHGKGNRCADSKNFIPPECCSHS